MSDEHERKPGSEGRPWSDPESDPLADILDAQRRALDDYRSWRPDTP